MNITHDLLLHEGFTELPNRPHRYTYQGMTGRLEPTGVFYFHGFSPPITTVQDLRYMKMIIAYNTVESPGSTLTSYEDRPN